MKDIYKAAQKALERLEIWMDEHGCQRDKEAIAALRTALMSVPDGAEQPAEQEPLTDAKILSANYPSGEESEPIIAAPDTELIQFARAVMAVQKDEKGQPMAYWHDKGYTAPQPNDTALLRQALEALERGETKLRFEAISALRERVGEKT